MQAGWEPSPRERHAPLLELAGVRVLRGSPVHGSVVLDDVTFEVHRGEHAAVYGRSGMPLAKLMRIAAGIDRPAAGTVRYLGCDLAADRGELTSSLSLAMPSFQTMRSSAPAVDHVASALLRMRLTARERSSRAYETLRQLDAPTSEELHDLSTHELMLVALARALVGSPRLVLVDDPAQGADPVERARMAHLLTEIAARGPGVLSFATDTAAVAGARLMLLDGATVTGRVRPHDAKIFHWPGSPDPRGREHG